MAVVTTPLGFLKPDGNELVRQGDNVIAANAQRSQDLLSKARADIANLLTKAGFTGSPVALQDSVVAALMGDEATETFTAVEEITTVAAVAAAALKADKTYVDDEVDTRVPHTEAVVVGGNTYKSRYREWSGPNGLAGGGQGGLAIGEGAASKIVDYTSAAASQSFIAIGRDALGNSYRGRACIAIGDGVMAFGEPGFGNLGIGTFALSHVQGTSEWAADMVGSRNIGIGSLAGHFITSGQTNILIGRDSGHSITTGTGNVAVGYRALACGYAPIGLSGEIENQYATFGANNVAVGINSLTKMASSGNVGIGANAGASTAMSGNSTFVGQQAGANIGIDISENNKVLSRPAKSFTYTVANGVITITSTAHGAVAGNKVQVDFETGPTTTITTEPQYVTVATVASANVFTLPCPATIASGSGSGTLNLVETATSGTPGSSLVAIGWSALGAAKKNAGNTTAVGEQAGMSSEGAYNTFIGSRSGFNLVNGANNTMLGYNSGRASLAGSALDNVDYVTTVGSGAGATGSNQVQLGGSADTTYVYGTVQNRSDARDKADVRDTVLGLDFINELRPVDYRWDLRDDYFEEDEDGNRTPIEKDGSKKRARYHHGLIAQELPDGFGGVQDHSINGGSDILSVGYDELIAPLIKAVQELSAQVASLKVELGK